VGQMGKDEDPGPFPQGMVLRLLAIDILPLQV
jgi:hypothetical protein